MNQWEGESNSEALAAILQTGPFYSVCFILTIVADCLCVVCGILGIISWRANGSELV